MPKLYIIAGCNGAGKTTASFTLLPEMFQCKEFVNADIIAAKMAPGNPESAALQAGRLMLMKVNELMREKADFAFETTLATRSYVSLIRKAQTMGYEVILLFFWLNSPAFAIDRVAERVEEGGHHIPSEVVERRFYRGIKNLIELYIPVCDHWLIIDNMDTAPEEVILGSGRNIKLVIKSYIWDIILQQSKHHEQ